MISKEDALQKFKEIVGKAESWEQLLESQFTLHISLFQSIALREALFKTERVYQEYFLATAINASSIAAHAQDRDYLPRKPSPSKGTMSVKNNGLDSVFIPEGTFFSSDNGLLYRLKSANSVLPGATLQNLEIEQIEQSEIVHTVDEEKTYYEILIATEITPKIYKYEVWVDETGDGLSFVQWSYKRLFQNTSADEKAFDEFYKYTGETGIRFGNGVFGHILPLGSIVKIKLFLTSGETYLLSGQPLLQIGELLDDRGQPAKIEPKTSSVISGGINPESTYELHRNLHYWPIYKEDIIWKDDFVFFIKKNFPEVVWANAWGEKEQIEESQQYSLDYINRIYITAHYDSALSLRDSIMNSLNAIPRLNRQYEWVDPVMNNYQISVVGKMQKNRNIEATARAIKDVLLAKYGFYSFTRSNKYNEHEAYAAIQAMNLFSQQNEYFLITQSGAPLGRLNEIYGINEADINLDLRYL